jgi:hypothetical protein
MQYGRNKGLLVLQTYYFIKTTQETSIMNGPGIVFRKVNLRILKFEGGLSENQTNGAI